MPIRTLLSCSRSAYEHALDEVAQSPDVAQLSGRRICIVGCTGLLGNTLLSILERANHRLAVPIEVYGIARNTSPELTHENPHFHWIQSSVTDPALVERIPDWDYIIYMAGATSDYLQRRTQIIETQMSGLETWLSRATGCRGFVFISSTRVYGRQTGNEPIDEERQALISPMHLDNIYDAHKWFAESLCLWHARFAGVPAVVARISNVYGASVNIRSETAITSWIRDAITHKVIHLRGPASVRNYCSAPDMAQGLLKAAVHGRAGCAYNLGSHEHFSAREFAQTLAQACPFEVGVREDTGGDASIVRISIARAQTELGFEPRGRWSELAPFTLAQTARGLGLSMPIFEDEARV